MLTKLRMIQNYIKGKSNRVGFVHRQMKSLTRGHNLEAFMDEMEEKDGDKLIRKRKENYQYLLGTMETLGSGHQLTRASTLILMEPNPKFESEMQTYARIHRLGQMSEKIYTFRLVDSDSEYEEEILKVQAQAGQFPGRPRGFHEDVEDEVEEEIWVPPQGYVYSLRFVFFVQEEVSGTCKTCLISLLPFKTLPLPPHKLCTKKS